jgi:hypothetical protein
MSALLVVKDQPTSGDARFSAREMVSASAPRLAEVPILIFTARKKTASKEALR